MIRAIPFLFVMFAFANSFAINGYSLNKRYAAGDTVTWQNLRANLDSGANFSVRLVDTLDKKFVRFTDVKDSTFQKVKADSIRSNPDIDSIQGNPFVDTITTRRVVADSVIGPVRGNVTGSVSGNVTGSISGGTIAGSTGLFSSTVSVDSLLSTKGVKGSRFYGPVTGDVTGNVTGNVVGSISGGAVAGSTGTFTSTVAVDSLKSTKGINVTTGAFSGVVSVDSLKSTKGINSTTLNTGNGDNELYAMNQNVRTTDNVQFDSITCTKVTSGEGWTEIPVYNTGSFECTLKVVSATGYGTQKDTIGTAYYVKSGNVCTVFLSSIDIDYTELSTAQIYNWPQAIMPNPTGDTYMTTPIAVSGSAGSWYVAFHSSGADNVRIIGLGDGLVGTTGRLRNPSITYTCGNY